MNYRRLNTVHDLAGLRLHADGSRVASARASSILSSVSGQNVAGPSTLGISDSDQGLARRAVRSRLATYTVKDAQGNWIADDAGNVGQVKVRARLRSAWKSSRKRRSVEWEGPEGGVEEGESFVDRLRDEESRARSSAPPSGEDEIERPLLDSRARKRQKFYHDFSFLDSMASHTASAGPSGFSKVKGKLMLPVPSSDLLKVIHFFASEFYTQRGRLFNAGRQFRKERKEKLLNSQTQKDDGDENVETENETEDSGESERDGMDDLTFKPVGGRGKDKERKKKKRERKDKDELYRDMYRAFDGTALMAIGMILQEHIYEQVTQGPPEGWAEEMQKAEARKAARALRKSSTRAGKRRFRRKGTPVRGNEDGVGGHTATGAIDVKGEGGSSDDNNESDEDEGGASDNQKDELDSTTCSASNTD